MLLLMSPLVIICWNYITATTWNLFFLIVCASLTSSFVPLVSLKWTVAECDLLLLPVVPLWSLIGESVRMCPSWKTIMLYFVCTAAESKVLKFFISKHLFPGRYCAGRLVKRSGHQWICPASASENGWLRPLGCPLAATRVHKWKITKLISKKKS